MYVFIINPTAGSGRAKRIYSTIQESQLYKDIQSETFFTTTNGNAEKVVRELVRADKDRIRAFIIIGGDGTLHEVVNGIGHFVIPVAIIPSGSGNDFSRATSISKNPLTILELIVEGKDDMPYWLGNYKFSGRRQRQFVNSIGFGFDAYIAQTANRSCYKKILNKLHLGNISYIIALLQVLFRYQPMNLTIEVNGETRVLNNCFMVTIGNHPYYGGGMKIIPNASIQPTTFPVLMIHSISRWKILGLFMTVFTGKHIRYKEVELLETTSIEISSTDDMYYQVDGETYVGQGSCLITKQSTSVPIVGTKTQTNEKIAL